MNGLKPLSVDPMTPSEALSHPAGIEERLNEIDERLSTLADEFEDAAKDWFKAKKHRDQTHATVYVSTLGGHSERKAAADLAASEIGWEAEGRWEGMRQVLKTLETRSMVGASLLKLQTRLGA